MLYETASLICVAILWGCTNPLIRSGSKDVVKVQANNKLKQFLLEITYLVTNYLIPMTLNQCGSILYFITLQRTDLSLTVPVANSLTFVFTAITGWIIGEELPKKNTTLGILFICLGTMLCYYDKYRIENK